MSKQRKIFLDILRVAAALAVALYHVLTGAASLDPEVSALTAKVIEALSRSLLWHVPTFLLITGFLWLSDEKECTWRKVLPGIRRFVLVLFTVGLGFAILERFFRFRTLNLELLGWSVLDVLIGNLWDHMWYVYAVIGIYLVLPVIKPFFQHSSVKSIGLFTGLLFLLTIFIPNVEHSTGYHFPVSFPMANPAYPAFYICAGGLISKLELPKKTAWIGMATFALSVCSCFAMMMIVPSWVRWTNIFSGISAISLFVAVKGSAQNTKELPALRGVSDCTFGIYLFHQLFINIFLKVLPWYPLRNMAVLSLLGLFLGVTTWAFLVTFLLRKIPPVKKYIL
jgi:surface polysaccharide O-acyltransferase-like enzyme